MAGDKWLHVLSLQVSYTMYVTPQNQAGNDAHTSFYWSILERLQVIGFLSHHPSIVNKTPGYNVEHDINTSNWQLHGSVFWNHSAHHGCIVVVVL